jgi:hypothetical protein
MHFCSVEGLVFINLPNTASTGQVRAFAHTLGDSAPTADSASGGFIRHISSLPVTQTVSQPFLRQQM